MDDNSSTFCRIRSFEEVPFENMQNTKIQCHISSHFSMENDDDISSHFPMERVYGKSNRANIQYLD